MIYKDFVYVKPDTLEEARETYLNYLKLGKNPFYYSGGTEVVAFTRKGLLSPDVLIDLKGVKTLKNFGFKENYLVIGSNVTLNEIIDSEYSKILSVSLKGIADRSVRNRITIGGNIVGQLPFREAVLPLLIFESKIRIFGEEGLKEYKLNEIFDKSLKINKGDIVVEFEIDKEFLNLDFYYERKTFYSKVDYPIISSLFVRFGEEIRIALTGCFNYPLRDKKIEEIYSDKSLSINEKIDKIQEYLYSQFKSDFRASKEYRIDLFKNIFNKAYIYFGGK